MTHKKITRLIKLLTLLFICSTSTAFARQFEGFEFQLIPPGGYVAIGVNYNGNSYWSNTNPKVIYIKPNIKVDSQTCNIVGKSLFHYPVQLNRANGTNVQCEVKVTMKTSKAWYGGCKLDSSAKLISACPGLKMDGSKLVNK